MILLDDFIDIDVFWSKHRYIFDDVAALFWGLDTLWMGLPYFLPFAMNVEANFCFENY